MKGKLQEKGNERRLLTALAQVAVSVVLLACSGHGGMPSERDAQAAAQQRVRGRFLGHPVTFTSFSKTDGQYAEAFGVPTYRLSYRLGFIDVGYYRARGYPDCAGAGCQINGVVTFQKTENGWQAVEVVDDSGP